MNPLEITDQEQQLLVQVLHRALADLNHEILHTDNAGFKQMLRQRRSILESLTNKLPQAVAEAV